MMKLDRGDDVLRAILSGELDHHSAREIRAELDAVLCEMMPHMLILDFGDSVSESIFVTGILRSAHWLSVP